MVASARRRSGKGLYGNSPVQMKPGGMSFTIDEIKKATKNFSPLLKIGQGGFGIVYKGVLGDGTLVAVKRAKKSVYDSNLGTEFQSEVQALARIEHLNLVRCLGYLEHEEERLVIVEYVPNGTLREHLDGLRGSQLDLASRLDIAIDVAHSITYLHMYTVNYSSESIPNGIGFGGKENHFGFFLSADFDQGHTFNCTTFNSPCLSKSNQIRPEVIECWGVVPIGAQNKKSETVEGTVLERFKEDRNMLKLVGLASSSD